MAIAPYIIAAILAGALIAWFIASRFQKRCSALEIRASAEIPVAEKDNQIEQKELESSGLREELTRENGLKAEAPAARGVTEELRNR